MKKTICATLAVLLVAAAGTPLLDAMPQSEIKKQRTVMSSSM